MACFFLMHQSVKTTSSATNESLHRTQTQERDPGGSIESIKAISPATRMDLISLYVNILPGLQQIILPVTRWRLDSNSLSRSRGFDDGGFQRKPRGLSGWDLEGQYT